MLIAHLYLKCKFDMHLTEIIRLLMAYPYLAGILNNCRCNIQLNESVVVINGNYLDLK